MNISQRLRTCAKHTCLDAVIELLQEAADEIDALQARAQVQGGPIGEVGTMPGTSGFTMACFRAGEVPVGTKIYTTPQPAQAGQAEVADAALIRELVDHIERNTCTHEETHRGGAIWEVCDSCGARWADDEGGKPEFKWPAVVEKARAILALRPERVQMTDEALWTSVIEHLGPEALSGGRMSILDAFHLGITVAEAHHGITAQAKKEGA